MGNGRGERRVSSNGALVYTTSLTLLERLRQPDDQAAWTRFVELYTPLLYRFARTAGLQEQDAADLVQDIFELLVRKLPAFRHDRRGSFRAWLRTITLNKWRERFRRAGARHLTNTDGLDQIMARDPADTFEEAEYRRQLVGRALRVLQPGFSPTSWTAFQEHVVAGRDAAAVAAELGIAVGTVYAAKSRILTRLRHHLDGLLD
jgi:RNA polymerase sigma-70 factor (ECF subfamily)